jgi:hypothetical protein
LPESCPSARDKGASIADVSLCVETASVVVSAAKWRQGRLQWSIRIFTGGAAGYRTSGHIGDFGPP